MSVRIGSVLVAIMFLCHTGYTQTQGGAPFVVDSFSGGDGGTCGSTVGCVDFKEGVAANDAIICGANQIDVTAGCTGGSNTTWQFTDSLSTNLTMGTMQNNGDTPATINKYYSNIGYTCVAASHASYQVNWTSGESAGCVDANVCFRVKNICSSGTMTADGSNTGSNTGGATGVSLATDSFTTTALNDFVFSMGSKAEGNGGGNRIQGTGLLNELTGNIAGFAWEIAPVLGSNSVTWADMRNGNGRRSFAGAWPFKVPMQLADTVMPQGAVGVPYSADLHPFGGVSSTPTFACTGLPSHGISLNTSTGHISGTPTIQGSLSLSCTFNDGVTTSPADSLSITIGGGFRTPTRVGGPAIGHINAGGGSFNVTGTTCGDIITVQAQLSGQKQSISGINNYFHIDDGSPVQEYFSGVGSFQGPDVIAVFGPLVSGGTRTISTANSLSQSPASDYLATDWTNLQGVLDPPVTNTIIATSNSSSVSTSYTTVQPNEVVLVSGSSGLTTGGGGISSMSISSPFTSSGSASGFNAAEYYQFGYDIVSSPTALTPTVNLVGTNWGCSSNAICDPALNLTVALRPRLPIGACGESIGMSRQNANVF